MRDTNGNSASQNDLVPNVDNAVDIGRPNKRYKHGYFVDVSTENHPSVDQALTAAGGTTDLQSAYDNGTGAINLSANKPFTVNDGEVVVDADDKTMTIGPNSISTVGGDRYPPGLVINTGGQRIAEFKYDALGMYQDLDMQTNDIRRIGNATVEGALAMGNIINMNNNRITTLADPTGEQDAVNKRYADSGNTLQKGYDNGDGSVTTQAGKPLRLVGDVQINGTDVTDAFIDLNTNKLSRDGSLGMTGNLNMTGNNVRFVAAPIDAQDAATKEYVDNSAADLSELEAKTQNISTETDATKTVMTQPLVLGTATAAKAVTSFNGGVNLNTGTCGFSFTVNQPIVVTRLAVFLSSWRSSAAQKEAGIWKDGVETPLVSATVQRANNNGVEAYADIAPLTLEQGYVYIVGAFQESVDSRQFDTVTSQDINFISGRNNYLSGPDPFNPPPNVFGYPNLGGAVFGFASFAYVTVAERKSITCSDVFCQNVFAQNTMGPVISFGANIGGANAQNYVIPNGRGNEGGSGSLFAYTIHCVPIAGLVSVSVSKGSAQTHTFTLARANVDTGTAIPVKDFVFSGRLGYEDTNILVQRGEGIVIKHAGGATEAPGNVTINLYIRPVGQVRAGKFTTGSVSNMDTEFTTITERVTHIESVMDALTN
jgi:hypothetical protein